MITDELTNTVFLSNYLEEECPELYASLTNKFKDHFGKDCKIIKSTKDIWCRDYMPIQVSDNRFVAYDYNPDYLQKEKRYITKWNDVKGVDFLNYEEMVVKLNLKMDGGNVVKCGDKIVMTDKVFCENETKSRFSVLKKLEDAFQCEIVFLLWDKEEIYGHSDGIIHYLGGNRVIFTNYADFDKAFANNYLKVLEKHFEVITLKYDVKEPYQNNWAYVNFLQVGNLVLVPQLGIPEDEQALQQIAAALPQCKVEGVPALEAVRNGGALNCVSWNVRI